jgi:peptidoglycan hydrolase CwlO-like protein
MALMLSKTYAAFKAAGVDEDQAQAAAEELAGLETRFASLQGGISHMDAQITTIDGKIGTIESKITTIEGKVTTIEGRMLALEGKFGVLLWAVGINAAATIAILGVLLHHG